jgi:branched-chain amino acid transport system substrate-binding protein
MRKNQVAFYTGVLIIIGVVIAALAGTFLLRAKEEGPIKIGAIISLSGSASHLTDVRDAMLLAVKEINFWGGVNGRKIELIVGDSEINPEEGQKAFSRIETEHHPVLY